MLRFLIRLCVFVLLAAILLLICLRAAAFWRESQSSEALLRTLDPGDSRGRMIQTSSGDIYTLSNGPTAGQTILIAHGTAAWSGFWSPQLTVLGDAGYRAIAFDMPPFGFSQRATDGDYSRKRQATRILDLVEALDTRPIMVAHSFGAAAATEAVLQKPKAFAGLVIIDGAIGLEDAPEQKTLPLPLRPRLLREAAVSASATNPLATRTLLKGLLYNKEAASAPIVRTLQLPQSRTGTTAANADWLPSLLAPATDPLSRAAGSYGKLSLPVRIIWGDQDTVTPPDQAEALAKAIGQGPVHYLKDVGHIPHIEAPEAFDALLLKLLAQMR